MKSLPFVMPQQLTRRLSAAALAAAAILAVTAVIAPDRAWANLFLGSFFLVTLGLGGALFIALTNVCGASWSVAFRRVPEALTGLLPLGGALLLVALLAHLRKYGWHHHGDGDPGTFWFKQLWLEPKFFAARAVALCPCSLCDRSPLRMPCLATIHGLRTVCITMPDSASPVWCACTASSMVLLSNSQHSFRLNSIRRFSGYTLPLGAVGLVAEQYRI